MRLSLVLAFSPVMVVVVLGIRPEVVAVVVLSVQAASPSRS